MEALKTLWQQSWKPLFEEWIQQLTPLHGAIAGALVLVYIIYRIAVRRKHKKRLRAVAPQLTLDAFQIAPLGRDAFFKIRNNGHSATLITLTLMGRNDIIIKSDYAGHQIDHGKVYGILLEAGASQRIQNDFSIEVSYIDTARNVYKQLFDLRQQVAFQPKLVKAFYY